MVRRTRPGISSFRVRSFHSRPGMTPTSSLQRLLDLGLEHGIEIRRGDRAYHLVDDVAFAADNEGLGHAIDAPFDRGAAFAVDADNAERIAVTAEKAPGVVRRVFVVDADHLQPLVPAKLGQERRRIVAGSPPR